MRFYAPLLLFLAFFTQVLFAQGALDEAASLSQSLKASDEEGDVALLVDERYEAKAPLLLALSLGKDSVYEGEVFSLQLEAVANESSSFTLGYRIDAKDIEILRSGKWIELESKKRYRRVIELVAKSPKARLSGATVLMYRNNALLQEAKESVKLGVMALEGQKDFSGLVGKDLSFGKAKCSSYDESKILCAFEVKGLANYAAFVYPDKEVQASLDIKEDLSKALLTLVLPNTKKEMGFTYFSTSKKAYLELKLLVQVQEDELLSAELGPIDAGFDEQKQVGVLITGLVFLVLFVLLRFNYACLLVSLTAFAFLMFSRQDMHEARLKSGATLRILPTSNSSIFGQTDKMQTVQVLLSRGKYKKILLPNEQLAWVGEEFLEVHE